MGVKKDKKDDEEKVENLLAIIKYDKKFLKTDLARKDKLLLILSYLKLNSAINGSVGISINLLITKIGYSPDTHKNRINSKVIEILRLIEQSEYIHIEADLTKVRSKDCFIIQINKDSDIFNCKNKFVVLTELEFNTITQSTEVKSDKQDLLNVFLNIKKFINFDAITPNLCYPSHATLCRDCSISSTGAMNNIINELVKIGILYTYNSGKYKDDKGNIKYANSFYAIEDNVLKPEICDSIIKEYYANQGLIIDEFIKDK